MIYDIDLFEKYRALAITKKEDLVEGKTYYTNSYPVKFTLLRIETEEVGGNMEDKAITTAVCGFSKVKYDFFLKDHNIGSQHNPWLIFANQNLAKACEEELKIIYEQDLHDDRDDDDDIFEDIDLD